MELNGQTSSEPATYPASKWSLITRLLFVGIPAAIISLFIAATPPGLWEKARLIGYELCHPLPVVDGRTVGVEYVHENARLAAEYMLGVIAEARKQRAARA